LWPEILRRAHNFKGPVLNLEKQGGNRGPKVKLSKNDRRKARGKKKTGTNAAEGESAGFERKPSLSFDCPKAARGKVKEKENSHRQEAEEGFKKRKTMEKSRWDGRALKKKRKAERGAHATPKPGGRHQGHRGGL